MKYVIEHVSIRCRKIEASIEYYQKMFGAQVMLRRNLPNSKQIVYLQIGDTMLELMDFGSAAEPIDPREHYGVTHIGIKTDDFDSAYRDLKSKGADFLGSPSNPRPASASFFKRAERGDPRAGHAGSEKLSSGDRSGTVNW